MNGGAAVGWELTALHSLKVMADCDMFGIKNATTPCSNNTVLSGRGRTEPCESWRSCQLHTWYICRISMRGGSGGIKLLLVFTFYYRTLFVLLVWETKEILGTPCLLILLHFTLHQKPENESSSFLTCLSTCQILWINQTNLLKAFSSISDHIGNDTRSFDHSNFSGK